MGGLYDRPLKDLHLKREGFPRYLTRQGPEARRIFKLRKCSYAVSYVYITVAIVAQAT